MPSLLPIAWMRRRKLGARSWPLVMAASMRGSSERTRAILAESWSARAGPCTTIADATAIDQTTAVLRRLTEKRMDMVPALAVAPAEQRKACSKASLASQGGAERRNGACRREKTEIRATGQDAPVKRLEWAAVLLPRRIPRSRSTQDRRRLRIPFRLLRR